MKNSYIHIQFIIRQIIRSRRQGFVFLLCVALSIVTLISLNGFSDSVRTSMQKDAKKLNAADIIIHSHHDLSPAVIDAVARLEAGNEIEASRVWEFYSMVRPQDNQDALLAKLKVVQAGYPFYGKVVLRSGRDFSRALTKGSIIVAPALLDRLKLDVGHQIKVGNAVLKISDVVLTEPDQPVNFFFLGPRIFVSAEDLSQLELLTKRSRVTYNYLIKVFDQSRIDPIANRLRAVADEELERVDTFQTARSGVNRFFDNLLFFLSFIGIFTLLLAGVGIQSALIALLKENEKTIAIMKTIGATSRFFSRHYILILSVLGLGGTTLGLVGGLLLQKALNVLFVGFVPPNVQLQITWQAVFQGLCLGVLVVGLYSFIPLYGLKNIKPVAVFRKEAIPVLKGWSFYLISGLLFIFFLMLVFWQVQDIRTALYYVGGIILLIIITALLAGTVLYILKRLKVKFLVVRQAIRGLYRPKNATKPIIITLTASLTVIFSIYQVEQNLDAAFIQSYPADAPNLFFLDILPDQKERFSDMLDMKAQYYPIIRARILTINGEKINRQKERRRRSDNLARTFNLTYRNYLLEDEKIVKGGRLHNDDWGDLQVSVMDTVAKIKDMQIGDRITFNIQGVPLQARISSIRTRTRESIRPFFYFVFPEQTLQEAPQTIFTAVNVPRNRIALIQAKIAANFPNISAIDVTETLKIFTQVMKKLSLIVRFFALFSIVAGVLIILSSVLATRFARIQEAVYYKILGAKGAFVAAVFTLENLFLGLVSASLALVLSQTCSWIICSKVFEISYTPFMANSFLLIAATVLLIVTVGLLPSSSILRQKPVIFLRNQSQE
ncbi:MAG: ABC transporter permease [Desulfobacterales bacterium]